MMEHGTRAELRGGWRTILVAAIGVCAGVTGLPFYTVGLLVRPISNEFGWGRGAVSVAALCLQLGIVVSAPVIGWVIDRIGLRRVALGSLGALALGFAALSLLGRSLPVYYAAWLLLSVAGCGTTPLVWTRAVVDGFSAARGLALGLTLLGTGIAGILAPALIGRVILVDGWRAGCLTLAVLIVTVALPIVYALLPETARIERLARERVGLGMLLRDATFRRIAAAFLLLGLGVTGLIVHLVPILVDRGRSDASATGAAAMLGFAVMAGRVLVGFLVDRIWPPLVAFCFLVLPAISCVLLLVGAPAIAAVLLLGLAAGAEIDLLAFFVSRHFSIAHYGAIYGWALSIFSLGAGFGPVITGAAFDRTGSYQGVLIVSALVIASAAATIAGLGAPDRTVR